MWQKKYANNCRKTDSYLIEPLLITQLLDINRVNYACFYKIMISLWRNFVSQFCEWTCFKLFNTYLKLLIGFKYGNGLGHSGTNDYICKPFLSCACRFLIILQWGLSIYFHIPFPLFTVAYIGSEFLRVKLCTSLHRLFL